MRWFGPNIVPLVVRVLIIEKTTMINSGFYYVNTFFLQFFVFWI